MEIVDEIVLNDNKDPFSGNDPEALAKFVVSLGVAYLPYEQTIIDRGLCGAFLLERVDDVENFSKTLENVGINVVSFFFFFSFFATHFLLRAQIFNFLQINT